MCFCAYLIVGYLTEADLMRVPCCDDEAKFSSAYDEMKKQMVMTLKPAF